MKALNPVLYTQTKESMAPRLPPALHDRYIQVEPLGQGAYGRVLKARDSQNGESVAIKLLHPRVYQESAMMKRFEREAVLTTRIESPHVCQVKEWGVDEGRPYLVLHFIEGCDLEKRLIQAGGKISFEEALPIYYDILEAIAAAHSVGVLHRDLKPDNILLGPKGAVLTDFGLSRDFESASLTMAGEMVGTASHMTPQQLLGEDASFASDIYAATLILVEAVTGEEVFPAPNFIKLRERKLLGPNHALLDRGIAVSPEFDQLIRSALSGDVETRPKDAALFLQKLKAVDKHSEPHSPSKPWKQWGLWLGLGALAAGALAAYWGS